MRGVRGLGEGAGVKIRRNEVSGSRYTGEAFNLGFMLKDMKFFFVFKR